VTASTVQAPLERLLAAQRAASATEGIASARLRRNRIDRLIALLLNNTDALTSAMDDDFGYRPAAASAIYDVGAILPDLNYLRSHLHKWMKTRAPLRLGALGLTVRVEPRPLGVVGIIGPWNFPVALVAQPAAAAFAAGNRVMAKMSELTPATASLFTQLVADYFDPEEFVVITGDASVGRVFAAQQFDHLFFTGSPAVGSAVAQAAAANLVPVTLELGGKNPLVASRNADVAKVSRQILAARLVNGGQVCLCPDYAWIPADQVKRYADAMQQFYSSAAPTAPAASRQIALINDRNFARVRDLIEDAKQHGANVIHLTRDNGSPYDEVTRTISPTLVLGVTDDMAIAREEIFGPVLVIHPYRRIQEVVDYVSARPTPLAAYWYGKQGKDFDAFRTGVNSGGMTVNDFGLHCAMYQAPFGGVGLSGSGAYHGKTGFDRLTHYRTVATSRLPINFAELITPPFSPLLTTLTSKLFAWQRIRTARRLAKDHVKPRSGTG
jgi:coniferyl-aldehyde dehydrogenase